MTTIKEDLEALEAEISKAQREEARHAALREAAIEKTGTITNALKEEFKVDSVKAGEALLEQLNKDLTKALASARAALEAS